MVVLPGGRVAVGIIFWGLYIAVSRDVSLFYCADLFVKSVFDQQVMSVSGSLTHCPSLERQSPKHRIVCHLLGKCTGGF